MEIVTKNLQNNSFRMSDKENYYKDNKKEVDPRTKFIIGSPEYNNYYFPKIDKTDPNTIKKDKENDGR